jgi:hypothetical protein
MIGSGENFEELVRLGLCAVCFAERYLDTSSSRDDLLHQPRAFSDSIIAGSSLMS